MGRWKPRPWHRRFVAQIGAMGGGVGADVTAPSLSNAVDTAATPTTATLSVDTDEGNGTLYWVVTTSSSAPSATQVKAGQDHNGAAASDSGSQAVAGTGTQSISGGATGLVTGTYYAHFMHEDAEENQSTVASGDGFVLDLIVGETDGMAADFTESTGAGYVSVKDTATPANAVSNVSADSWWGNAGTSPKLVANSSGVLGWSPHNLVVRSEAFDNASWSKLAGGTGSAPAVTADAALSPDGSAMTADRVQFALNGGTTTSDFSILRQVVTTLAGATYTPAIWVKSNTASSYEMLFNDGVNNAVAITVTPSWQQIAKPGIISGTSINFQILLQGGKTPTNSDAADILVFGAQLNRGTVPTTYLATTTAARFGLGIDYANGSYGLLVEPAATNLALQSNDFATTWATNNSTIAANNATGPDGLTSADKLTESAGSALQNAYQSIAAFSSDTNYTLSVYAKAGTQSNIGIYLTKAGGGEEHIHATFNLATGATGETDVGTTSGTVTSSSITSVGNGWYRCVLVGKITETTGYFGITPLASATGNTFDASGEVSYAGTGKTIFLWGAQMELGTVATSPIPTFGSTVTRAKDNVTKVLTAIPNPMTTGTMIVHVTPKISTSTSAQTIVEVGKSADQSTILVAANVSDITPFIRTSSTTQMNADSLTDFIAGTKNKIGLAWAANDGAIVVDSGTPATDATITVPVSTDVIYLGINDGGTAANLHISQLIILPRRMSNADMQTRTAP